MANILIVGNRHLSKPNLSRQSTHNLIYPKDFPIGRFPLNKLWYPFNNLAAWQPSFKRDVVLHSFNSIPYTRLPFVLTGELFLPFFSLRPHANYWEEKMYHLLCQRLSRENCKKIILISDYARKRLSLKLKQASEWAGIREQVLEKVEVIHPNFPAHSTQPKTLSSPNQCINLVFVGNHFARKGGIVALRMAQKAYHQGLPIQLHIVSKLQLGAGIPTDFPNQDAYQKDLESLNLPNVKLHGFLPNHEVLQLMKACDFQLLPSLEDTYGFSVVEGFSMATPAITTNICALPELVQNEQTGYILDLPKSEFGTWSGYRQWMGMRNNPSSLQLEKYWEQLNQTYDDLADQMYKKLVDFWQTPARGSTYAALSQGALQRFETFHHGERVGRKFDEMYAQIAASR